MPDTPEAQEEHKPASWTSGPIIEWLLEEGRLLPDVEQCTRELGRKLLAEGAPLWRLRLSMRTLHPLTAAFSVIWERDARGSRYLDTPHGLEGRPGFLGSPLEIITTTLQSFRKQLSSDLTEDDHSILHEIKAQGGTDYYGTPMKYSIGTGATLVFTTDRAGGFSDQDIDRFEQVAAVLAPIAEVYSTRRISLAVAEAYLGARTGRRVLDGQITRGDIEKMDAAILVSDIRDWTGLNSRLAAEDALDLANGYFETVAAAVEANGGEILKFIGDGVLAVFPSGEADHTPEAACDNAVSAAHQALQNAPVEDRPDAVRFGIGLHFGEVLYGNIGSATRIDFTVLGQAVNIAARIEGLCTKLGAPLLFSEEFASKLSEPGRFLAEEPLKGTDGTSRIFTSLPSG